jgi:hypothetical protein
MAQSWHPKKSLEAMYAGELNIEKKKKKKEKS